MGRVRIDMAGDQPTAAVTNARRDAIVLTVLICAVMMLIWNGSAFFRELQFAGEEFGREAQFAWMALTLNIEWLTTSRSAYRLSNLGLKV